MKISIIGDRLVVEGTNGMLSANIKTETILLNIDTRYGYNIRAGGHSVNVGCVIDDVVEAERYTSDLKSIMTLALKHHEQNDCRSWYYDKCWDLV
ncbi:hypothetical protein NVP1244A_112 [Vibrio phage 1.244.A._10N.261.54.C3]|nr:hypothetical protein NVP1244A_112 [Vibrio phage 1.244.A._10N.261.54.C3]AUR98740.1 hypothetical protein NVP1255O_112 [Vibrio phage 1.255.O._10N.286.45.F1]